MNNSVCDERRDVRAEKKKLESNIGEVKGENV